MSNTFYQMCQLVEAEIVGGEVHDGDSALLQILLPYRRSNEHLVAIMRNGRVYEIGSPTIDAMPVDAFLRTGFSNWHIGNADRTREMALIRIADRTATVVSVDGNYQRNPSSWRDEHAMTMIRRALQMGLITPERAKTLEQGVDNHYRAVAEPNKDTDRPEDYLASDREWRQKLASHIYGELPWSLTSNQDNLFGARRYTANTNDQFNTVRNLLQHAQVDVVADRLPISQANLVAIHNPRIIEVVASFRVRAGFEGVREVGGGFLAPVGDDEKAVAGMEQNINAMLNDNEAAFDDFREVFCSMRNEADAYLEGDEDRMELDELAKEIVYSIEQSEDNYNNVITHWRRLGRLVLSLSQYDEEMGRQVWDDYGVNLVSQLRGVLNDIGRYLRVLAEAAQADEDVAEEIDQLRQRRRGLTRAFLGFAVACGEDMEWVRGRLQAQ